MNRLQYIEGRLVTTIYYDITLYKLSVIVRYKIVLEKYDTLKWGKPDVQVNVNVEVNMAECGEMFR